MNDKQPEAGTAKRDPASGGPAKQSTRKRVPRAGYPARSQPKVWVEGRLSKIDAGSRDLREPAKTGRDRSSPQIIKVTVPGTHPTGREERVLITFSCFSSFLSK